MEFPRFSRRTRKSVTSTRDAVLVERMDQLFGKSIGCALIQCEFPSPAQNCEHMLPPRLKHTLAQDTTLTPVSANRTRRPARPGPYHDQMRPVASSLRAQTTHDRVYRNMRGESGIDMSRVNFRPIHCAKGSHGSSFHLNES